MSDHSRELPPAEPAGASVSVGHLADILRAYLPVILLSLAAVATGYTVIALGLYLASPSEHITSQPFRLDFKGAALGEYPNGEKFSAADIVNTPVLVQVYQTNQLGRFCSFRSFSRSVFVLESNRAYEALVNDYQARLADPKLTPLDRDRIQREFEQKRASIAKNDFSISMIMTGETARIPKALVPKLLNDVLTAWATFVINEQHVLSYRVAVLSPAVVDASPVEANDPIIGVVVLRSKVMRILLNIADVNELPAAELARTRDGLSLAEIRLRMEDIVRFQLEPLVARVRHSLPNAAATVRFLETQVAYDQRQLASQQEVVASVRESLAAYTRPGDAPSGPTQTTRAEGETVMPQLSDTFLDRLVALTTSSSDAAYRQQLIDDYRRAMASIAPLQQAVAYDTQVLDEVKGSASAALTTDTGAAHDIESARAEAKILVAKVNEIYQLVSRNLNPSTQLYTMTGTTLSRTVRSGSLGRSILIGILLLLISLPLIIGACLLHNRIREERAMHMVAAAHEGEPIPT